MTDNEIIKALECCNQVNGCDRCPLWKDAEECEILNICALSLIKRQKAEIERLTKENEDQDQAIINALHRMGEIRSETIKEVAEKVKERFKNLEYQAITKRKTVSIDELVSQMNWALHKVALETIDDIVKEMTEDEGK